MTAIEFFDRTPLDNIISSITTVPDKIIFIGDDKEMKKFHSVHKAFLEKRNINTVLEYHPIKKNNLSDIVDKLTQIVLNEEECIFDITGGEDLVLVAMGIVYEKFSDKHIQMQRFNIRNGVVSDCDNDGNVNNTIKPKLSVEELVLINGGEVRYSDESEVLQRTSNWDLSDDFIRDVKNMWGICKNDPGYWNTRVNVMGQISNLSTSDDPLVMKVNVSHLKEHTSNVSVKYAPLSGLLSQLSKLGLVKDYKETAETLSYRYKNIQVKRCLEKAGTILEMIVLVLASELKSKDGSSFYTDYKNGVYIDWDGVFHNEKDVEKDTENEIDVILMRGAMPLFISCKNGHAGDDELYKLNSVAQRFGGPFVKKVLIATYLGKSAKSSQYFKQRAKDMNINLIDSVHMLSDEKFAKAIKHLVNG